MRFQYANIEKDEAKGMWKKVDSTSSASATLFCVLEEAAVSMY